MTTFERDAAESGFACIAGVDEAGRGPLAGPLVAAAVILAEPVAGLNDSKLLAADRRDSLFDTLHQNGHTIGVAIVEPAEIDRRGIQHANYSAMWRAAESLTPPAEFLLVDGFAIRGCPIPQRAIVKGDRRCLSIAAASIVAKVTRDRIMVDFDKQYPEYGFARHKGYATAAHLDAIERYGPCPIHRQSFAPCSRPAETGALFDEKESGA